MSGASHLPLIPAPIVRRPTPFRGARSWPHRRPYSLDALRALSEPALFGTDADALKAKYIAWYEEEAGRKLYPMQVEMLLISALAYAMSLLGEEGQNAVREGLATFATPTGLEALGPNRATPRLPASKARVTLRFAADVAGGLPVLIPRWTRVSAGSEATTFLTLADTVLPANALSVDVGAEAEMAGAAANDLQVGQIATLLDPVPPETFAELAAALADIDLMPQVPMEVLQKLAPHLASARQNLTEAARKGTLKLPANDDEKRLLRDLAFAERDDDLTSLVDQLGTLAEPDVAAMIERIRDAAFAGYEAGETSEAVADRLLELAGRTVDPPGRIIGDAVTVAEASGIAAVKARGT